MSSNPFDMATPQFFSLRRLASPSPSSSPKRNIERFPHSALDPLLSDLSPSRTLEALSSSPTFSTDTRASSSALRASIAAASPTQRAFAVRAAVAHKKLREWAREVGAWEWLGEGGLDKGFLTPTWEERAVKRRKLDGWGEGRSRDLAKSTNTDGAGAGTRLLSPVQLDGDNDFAAAFDPDEEYWGSIPARRVLEYEDRIEEIKREMDALDVEELKDRVLDAHIPSRSRPSSSYGQEREPPSFMNYVPLGDFTTLITATTLQALPYLSRVTRLINTWSVRISVLRVVPTFLRDLDMGEEALKLAFDAVTSPTVTPPEPKGGAGSPSRRQSDIGIFGISLAPHDIKDEMSSTSPTSDFTRETFNVIRGVLEEKVASLGQLLDNMLDDLEGRDDIIPEQWIEKMEAVEENYGAWVVEAEKKVLEYEWRQSVETQTREAAKVAALQPPKEVEDQVVPKAEDETHLDQDTVEATGRETDVGDEKGSNRVAEGDEVNDPSSGAFIGVVSVTSAAIAATSLPGSRDAESELPKNVEDTTTSLQHNVIPDLSHDEPPEQAASLLELQDAEPKAPNNAEDAVASLDKDFFPDSGHGEHLERASGVRDPEPADRIEVVSSPVQPRPQPLEQYPSNLRDSGVIVDHEERDVVVSVDPRIDGDNESIQSNERGSTTDSNAGAFNNLRDSGYEPTIPEEMGIPLLEAAEHSLSLEVADSEFEHLPLSPSISQVAEDDHHEQLLAVNEQVEDSTSMPDATEDADKHPSLVESSLTAEGDTHTRNSIDSVDQEIIPEENIPLPENSDEGFAPNVHPEESNALSMAPPLLPVDTSELGEQLLEGVEASLPDVPDEEFTPCILKEDSSHTSTAPSVSPVDNHGSTEQRPERAEIRLPEVFDEESASRVLSGDPNPLLAIVPLLSLGDHERGEQLPDEAEVPLPESPDEGVVPPALNGDSSHVSTAAVLSSVGDHEFSEKMPESFDEDLSPDVVSGGSVSAAVTQLSPLVVDYVEELPEASDQVVGTLATQELLRDTTEGALPAKSSPTSDVSGYPEVREQELSENLDPLIDAPTAGLAPETTPQPHHLDNGFKAGDVEEMYGRTTARRPMTPTSPRPRSPAKSTPSLQKMASFRSPLGTLPSGDIRYNLPMSEEPFGTELVDSSSAQHPANMENEPISPSKAAQEGHVLSFPEISEAGTGYIEQLDRAQDLSEEQPATLSVESTTAVPDANIPGLSSPWTTPVGSDFDSGDNMKPEAPSERSSADDSFPNEDGKPVQIENRVLDSPIEKRPNHASESARILPSLVLAPAPTEVVAGDSVVPGQKATQISEVEEALTIPLAAPTAEDVATDDLTAQSYERRSSEARGTGKTAVLDAVFQDLIDHGTQLSEIGENTQGQVEESSESPPLEDIPLPDESLDEQALDKLTTGDLEPDSDAEGLEQAIQAFIMASSGDNRVESIGLPPLPDSPALDASGRGVVPADDHFALDATEKEFGPAGLTSVGVPVQQTDVDTIQDSPAIPSGLGIIGVPDSSPTELHDHTASSAFPSFDSPYMEELGYKAVAVQPQQPAEFLEDDDSGGEIVVNPESSFSSTVTDYSQEHYSAETPDRFEKPDLMPMIPKLEPSILSGSFESIEEQSPSVRQFRKRRDTVNSEEGPMVSLPALQIPKRRAKSPDKSQRKYGEHARNGSDDLFNRHPTELSDATTLESPTKQTADDHLEQKINSILTTIPARIRLTTEADVDNTSEGRSSPPKHFGNVSPGMRSQRATSGSPSFTLAPAYAKNPRPRPKGSNPDIKLYHLHRSGGEAPIKLFVRLVGESGERVMVRVGGGWADLGEYLKEYASHHGRRSASDGRVEIQDIPNLKSRGSVASLAAKAAGRATPTTGRPDSAMSRPGSSLAFARSTRTVPLAEGASPPGDPSGRTPTTPQIASTRRQELTPPSGSSSISSIRSSSRLSWTDGEGETATPALGLAGPTSRRPEISAEKQAWVEGMLGQVRRASAKHQKLSAEAAAAAANPPPTTVERREELGFGDLGRVGGVKRVFRKAEGARAESRASFGRAESSLGKRGDSSLGKRADSRTGRRESMGEGNGRESSLR